MSRIKAGDTRPETLVRKGLWKLGYRYRKNSKLPRKPAIVFPRYRLAVFIDGCFRHRCPKHYQIPAINREYWEDKIGSNAKRDSLVNEQLASDGWAVFRYWEHQVKQCPNDVVLEVAHHLAAIKKKVRTD